MDRNSSECANDKTKTQKSTKDKDGQHQHKYYLPPYLFIYIIPERSEKRASRKNFCNFVCNKCHDGKELWRCCDLSHKVERMSNNICKAIFMDGVFKYIHWLAS